jgi:hypothetical protein
MTTENLKGKFTATHNLRRARFYFRLFFILAILIITAVWMDYWIRGDLGTAEKFLEIARSQWGMGVLIAGGLIYILLLSLPFVPGVELGVLLMCAFGKEGIVFIYLATVAGLSLAFVMGRLVPKIWIDFWLGKLGFSQFCVNHSYEIEEMLDHPSLGQKFCQHWLRPYLLKHRYLMIAVLFNIPGNYLLGGGGGISLACGISRSISWKRFLITVVLAVSPVPLLAFFGLIQLEAFLRT